MPAKVGIQRKYLKILDPSVRWDESSVNFIRFLESLLDSN